MLVNEALINRLSAQEVLQAAAERRGRAPAASRTWVAQCELLLNNGGRVKAEENAASQVRKPEGNTAICVKPDR